MRNSLFCLCKPEILELESVNGGGVFHIPGFRISFNLSRGGFNSNDCIFLQNNEGVQLHEQ